MWIFGSCIREQSPVPISLSGLGRRNLHIVKRTHTSKPVCFTFLLISTPQTYAYIISPLTHLLSALRNFSVNTPLPSNRIHSITSVMGTSEDSFPSFCMNRSILTSSFWQNNTWENTCLQSINTLFVKPLI